MTNEDFGTLFVFDWLPHKISIWNLLNKYISPYRLLDIDSMIFYVLDIFLSLVWWHCFYCEDIVVSFQDGKSYFKELRLKGQVETTKKGKSTPKIGRVVQLLQVIPTIELQSPW